MYSKLDLHVLPSVVLYFDLDEVWDESLTITRYMLQLLQVGIFLVNVELIYRAFQTRKISPKTLQDNWLILSPNTQIKIEWATAMTLKHKTTLQNNILQTRSTNKRAPPPKPPYLIPHTSCLHSTKSPFRHPHYTTNTILKLTSNLLQMRHQ